MDKRLEQSLLYDFYGELLTARQKEIYEQFIQEDLSLSEIALGAGISRQGVHDLIRRCDHTLREYEEKLHLVERFVSIREKVCRIDASIDQYQKDQKEQRIHEIKRIADEILEEL